MGLEKEFLNVDNIINMEKEFLNIKEYYDNPFNYARPMYDDIKYIFLIKEFLEEKCKNYLEIGVLYGFSMSLMMRSKYKTNFFGIDLFGEICLNDDIEKRQFVHYKEDVGGFSCLVNRPVKYDYNYTNMRIKDNNKNNYFYELTKGNSSDINVYNKISRKIIDGIDLLFIDGDHTYDGVKKDFELYSNLVNKDGIILFDDQDYTDIIEYMNEIEKNKKYFTIEVNNMGKIKRIFVKK